MAWIKCTKVIGEDVVLWTNASPSKRFDAQTVTVSDSIFNYSLIKIVGRGNAGTGSTPEWQTYVEPQYLSKCVTATDTKGCACLLSCSLNLSSGRMGRLVRASEDGISIAFGSTTSLGTSSSGSSDYIIPEQIIGIP